jgi:2-polyprenyl-3-methyl-5-hydroxy-6-metoxy-1,4-benzoquinol methylase
MPNKFKHRSNQTEMIDVPDISKELLFQNLHELDILNRKFGGHAITLQGIKKLVTDHNKIYHIADLGCGSGDTLKYIARWAKKYGYKVRLTGIDMNANAIEYLTHHCKSYTEINGVVGNYQQYLNNAKTVDIIHCSLFCHHLRDEEIVELFQWSRDNAITGFIINDLQRNWLAYHSAYIFTRLLNGSILSKNDGPISVLRGFKQYELRALLEKTGIEHYSIKRIWGFRWLVIGYGFLEKSSG